MRQEPYVAETTDGVIRPSWLFGYNTIGRKRIPHMAKLGAGMSLEFLNLCRGEFIFPILYAIVSNGTLKTLVMLSFCI